LLALVSARSNAIFTPLPSSLGGRCAAEWCPRLKVLLRSCATTLGLTLLLLLLLQIVQVILQLVQERSNLKPLLQERSSSCCSSSTPRVSLPTNLTFPVNQLHQ
jgi:hypothetical protein